jgi:7-cyano-7-deazaguanine synthase
MTGHEVEKPGAVVLLSGGLDSCVCLAEAVRGFAPAVLHLNYGQRTEARELQAFNAIADHYGIRRRLVVDVSWWNDIGGTSLVDASLDVETGLPDPDDETAVVPSTYVPFRNANILAIATAWAETIGARSLFIGAVEEDGSGYPDCTGAFFKAFEAAIRCGTRPDTHIDIKTPLLSLDKTGIVERGLELDAPLHLTWSCYVNNDKSCGECESCRLRLRGFERAGAVDPIDYIS